MADTVATDAGKQTAEPKAEPGASPAPDKVKGANGADTKGVTAEPETVPLGTFKDMERNYRALKKRADEWDAAEQARKDSEAKAAGNVEAAQKERDAFKIQAGEWTTYATTKLAEIEKALPDEDKLVLAALSDAVPLGVKLRQAELLQGRKRPDAGFGTKGGGMPAATAGLIPANVQTRAQYIAWIAQTSGVRASTAERLLHTDSAKAAAVEKEARERGLSK